MEDLEKDIELTPGTIAPLSIVKEMEESYLQYSMSVIVARALPDVRDGLKPVHRRILHVMNEAGLKPTAKYRKSATVVGSVMGDYHPHGDQAIYDSMVRMAQDFSTRYLMVDGQGNFGSMDGDPAAAYRYTEAKMTRHAEAMLADIDKDTVDWRPNFDGSKIEPVVLPARMPNLLLNGQIGIAVGMATSIPPHNLGEIADATIELIDNPDAILEDLMQYVTGPDFPTGGTIYGGENLRSAYASGRGSVVIRGVASIIENKSKKGTHQIIITEIPYSLNKATLVERMADLVRAKKIVGVSDIRDESSQGSVRIVIDLKKDAYPKKILNQLYKLSPLQSSFHFNMLALIDGIQPRVLGLEDILREFIKHRQTVVRRRTEFELRKAEARAHVLEGLTTALDHIDAVIKTIRASKTTDEAQINLIKQFKLSEIQAKAILAMQLRALAGLERQKVQDELKELKTIIANLKAVLGDEKKILKIIKDDILDLKKQFADERRSKIIKRELGKLSDEDLIPDEQVVVTLTSGNYIKRSPENEYKKQGRGGKGRRGMATKEEDLIEHLTFASTHQFLLFFTNRGRVFRIKTYEVPHVGLNAKGIAIVNLLQLQPEEIVTAMMRVPKGNEAKFMFMATKQGVVKKTPIDKFENVRTSGLIAIGLNKGDELKWIRLSSGEDDVIISTAMGRAIRFNEKDVRAMGRSARGVRGIRLKEGDEAIEMDIVSQGDNIFVISEYGYGKRTKIGQFTPHRRGGMGIKAAVINKKTGKIVSVKRLSNDTDEIIIISTRGQTIRLGLNDISELGRATQGVRIMRLNVGDTVAAAALAMEPNIDSEDKNEVTSTTKKPASKSTIKTKQSNYS
jgi:DNA gyrase subunit A